MVVAAEDYDLDTDLPKFLHSVLEKAEGICRANVDNEVVEQHLLVVDQAVNLLRTLRVNNTAEMNLDDKETLKKLQPH